MYLDREVLKYFITATDECVYNYKHTVDTVGVEVQINRKVLESRVILGRFID